MGRLLVMSVDALFTDDLPDVRHLPAFSELLGRAAIYQDVYGVYPTLTFPCHATIMSGCWPERHGVPHNERLAPEEKSAPWYWEHDAMHVPSVLDWAHRAGLTTAVALWPVTAGKPEVDWLVPEVPATSLDEYLPWCSPSVRDLVREKSDLLLQPHSDENWDGSMSFGEFGVQCLERIIREHAPEVVLTHQWPVDHLRHLCGLHKPQIQDALRKSDEWLGRIVAALRDAGVYDETTIVVLGDHGHLEVDSKLAPNVLLARAGLIDVDEAGRITGWRAYAQSAGVSCHLFVRDEADLPAARAALAPLAEQGLVTDEFTPQEARELYHEAGSFARIYEAAPSYAFCNDAVGELVTGADNSDYKYAYATHGHLPFRGEKPPFIIAGPGIEPGRFTGSRLVDEAPTMMRAAGIPFEAGELDGEDLRADGSRAVRMPETW